MTPNDLVREGTEIARNGDYQGAFAKYQQALDIDPLFVPAIWANNLIKLLLGDFSAWPEYEQFNNPSYSKVGWFRRPMNKPVWDGSPLHGRKLLLHCDGGYGDMINFVRYARFITPDGQVILDCHSSIAELMKTCAGIKECVPRFSEADHDIHCPLMYLPALFNIRSGYIPIFPASYLSPPVSHPLEKLFDPKCKKIGVVWKGNPKNGEDKNRSIDPSYFKKLKTGAKIYSLTKGDFADGMLNVGAMVQDWSETAFLVSQMDLIISVDTSVAHLAGALGKPVWMLCPSFPDWRWMLEREDSPWYASMRLFRNQNGWDEVFQRVNKKLETLGI